MASISNAQVVVPPGYKWARLGPVPEDWQLVSVFELAGKDRLRFDDGDWVEAQFITDCGIRLLQTGNIGVGTFIEKKPKKYISESSFDILKCKEVKPGDVLICRLADPVGRACIVPPIVEPRMVTAVDVTIFRPLPSIVDATFLLYVFSARSWFTEVRERCGGTTRSRIARRQLAQILVQVPRLDEQCAIAEALSDIDGLLQILEALIAKKRAVKRSVMQQLLTGDTRLPGFSSRWATRALGTVCTFLPTASNPRSDLDDHSNVEYIHYGDVHAHAQPVLNCIDHALPRIAVQRVGSATRLRDGDLVMVDASEDLEGVGKSVEVQNIGDRTVVAGLHTILCRGDDDAWAMGFKAYLQFLPSFRSTLARLAAGTSVYAISARQLAGIELRLPSRAEQAAIVSVLSDIEAEIRHLELRRDKTRAIKHGMMQQLLTGRVRLVEPAATAVP